MWQDPKKYNESAQAVLSVVDNPDIGIDWVQTKRMQRIQHNLLSTLQAAMSALHNAYTLQVQLSSELASSQAMNHSLQRRLDSAQRRAHVLSNFAARVQLKPIRSNEAESFRTLFEGSVVSPKSFKRV